MSARNGDKSRYGRLRKQKVQRRQKNLELRNSLGLSNGPGPTNRGSVMESAAHAIGSALGTLAAATHIAKREKTK
jgi:hypothetical protein